MSSDGLSRRRYLALAGSALSVGVAGCSSRSEGNGGSTTTDTDTDSRDGDGARATDTPTSTDTPASSGASFEVVEYDFPNEVKTGTSFTPSITVKNVGGQAGTLEETIYYTVGGSDWQEGGTWIFENVAPGAEKTVTSDGPWSFPWVTTLEFALGEREQTVTVETTPAKLSFGESFTNEEGMQTTMESLELKGAYEYTDYNDEQTREEAPNGMQWAFLQIHAENTGDEVAYTPIANNVSLVAGNQQYSRVYVDKEGGFETGEIQPDIVREGFFAYEIPENLSQSDVTAVWSDTGPYGDVVAHWSG